MALVVLTPFNLFQAAMVGVIRHIKGTQRINAGMGRNRYNADRIRSGWQLDCDGACGECAVAKWMGLYWDGGTLGNFRQADVAHYQVRTTAIAHGRLILHPDDADDERFILVLSHDAPQFTLAGWIEGAQGKQQKWWEDPQKGRPAFFVPQQELKSMEDFPRNPPAMPQEELL